jgi:hypothetical protein
MSVTTAGCDGPWGILFVKLLADKYLVSNQTPMFSTVDDITVYVHTNFLNAVRVWVFHQGLELGVLFERLLAPCLMAKVPDEAQIR